MSHSTVVRSPLIDGFSLAESGGVLRGLWPVAGFERLRDMLSSTDGKLGYEIRGDKDDFGRPALRVRISGPLQLTCQRCLTTLAHPLQVDSLLVLARNEAEIEALLADPEDPDSVLGGKEMAVGMLLEDEILLAVPFAPHHEICSGGVDERKADPQGSPFAKLRGLLDRGGHAKN